MEHVDDTLDIPPGQAVASPSVERSTVEIDAEFERFFIAHYDSILRSLDAATGDHEVAVDATQDAFIKAHTRWSLIRT